MLSVIASWLEWGCLLAALGAFTITEQYQPYVTGGLVLLAIAFLMCWLRTRRFIRRTEMELPGLLFVLSAGLATWIAYDRPTAMLQFARILAACVLFYEIASINRHFLPWLGTGFVLVAAFLAVYWPLQHDFAAGAVKIEAINRIGLWLTSHVPALPGPSIHANVGAGTLAISLPFAVAWLWESARSRRWWLIVAAGCSGVLIAFGLLLTASRGAWVGVLGAVGLAGLVWVQRRWFHQGRRVLAYWGALAVVGLIVALVLLASGWMERLFGLLPDPTGTLQSRPQLWAQGLPLIRDYLFTGSGLMTFRMVYATYGILIHAPFHDHLHNTFLEVWLEQGVLGAVAIVWIGALVVTWAWRKLQISSTNQPISESERGDIRGVWAWAGMAAVVIFAIHGIFDVVFYVTRTLPLLGLILGFAYHISPHPQVSPRLTVPRRLGWAAACLLISLLLAAIFHRPLLSAFYANLGALEQTRTELAIYDSDPFDDPTLDEARRLIDLSQAIEWFQKALDWDSTNPTALQRLSSIALSRGEYRAAMGMMQVAWDAGHRDEITRLLYGDALVADRQPQEAAEVVRGLTWAEGRMMFQAFYRYQRQNDLERASQAWQAVLALNPQNQQAIDWLSQNAP